MFALIGAAGLFGIQQWAHRDELKQKAAAALQSALTAASRTARLSSSADRRSASSDSSRSSYQQQGRAIRDGAFVCFKDRTGQVAVIQPYGNGGTWQLAVTCAAGGCCLLPEGAGNLAHISGDAVFLVRQVGNNFAFASPGAEGRYLSAVRDLSVAPVLDSTKLSAAAQWRVTSQGISNVLHPHKKLAFTVAEVKLVPLESIAAVEHSIADFNKAQQDKVCAAEAVSKALQAQLQEAAKTLTATTAEYDDQVELLKGQLREACSFNSQLTGLVEQKDDKLQLIRDHFSQMKTKYREAERELSTAYAEVATLQQQLAERDDDVAHLQQRMCNETKQWNQLRAALQDSLAAKDEEITALSLQVQRMEHALRSVEATLYVMRKPRRLDRASLDAVSIHQLQAAVNNFAAVGSGALLMPGDDMSVEEAEALRVLLEQQTAAGASSPTAMAGLGVGGGGSGSVFDLEPGTELSLQDLDRLDQTGSPDKHGSAAAAGGGKAPKSPTRAAAAAGGGGAGGHAGRVQQQQQQQQHATVSGRRANWPAGAVSGGRELLSTWGLSEDASALSSSRAARSSAASEGRHRYAGDASDCDSQDGDAAAEQHPERDTAAAAAGAAAAAAAVDEEGELDAAVCTSMDEDELQQQLGRLKASASQLTERASSSRSGAAHAFHTSSGSRARSSGHGSGRPQLPPLPQGPLHANRPLAAAAAGGGGGGGGGGDGGGISGSRPYASLSQLSPVKEDQAKQHHHRSRSSAGAGVAALSSRY